MGVKERKQRDKESIRRKILAAAETLFVQEGYENVSMRKLANRIEYSPTTIYHHFKDKEELLSCLVQEIFTQFIAYQDACLSEGPLADPVTAIRRGMRAYIQFGLENPNYYRLAFASGLLAKASPALGDGGGAPQQAFRILQQLVAAAIEQQYFPARDPALIAQTLWAVNHGITSLLLTHIRITESQQEELIGQVIDTALDGLLHQKLREQG
jgi:AcrR family transcriptional regulator